MGDGYQIRKESADGRGRSPTGRPPREIDGAEVVEWAWSGERPFGLIRFTTGGVVEEIFGFAICRYPDADGVYRFSCDRNWETVGDFDHDSVEEAKASLSDSIQFDLAGIVWQQVSAAS